MSMFANIVRERQQKSEEWQAQKAAEREDLAQMSDRAILTATQDQAAYLRYLNAQADNPGFSPTNILLILEQNPSVSVVNSMKGWNELGRSVIGGETGIKVRVSAPYVQNGQERVGYNVGRVFDLSQTSGTATVERPILRDDQPEMAAALRKLLDCSRVKVVLDDTLTTDAIYDPAAQVIRVMGNIPDEKAFPALAREMFHAVVHNRGNNKDYSREQTVLDAASVSYMLCRSFGVPCEVPNLSELGALYDGMAPQDRRAVLDSMNHEFRYLQGAIQKEITPPEKKSPSRVAPER